MLVYMTMYQYIWRKVCLTGVLTSGTNQSRMQNELDIYTYINIGCVHFIMFPKYDGDFEQIKILKSIYLDQFGAFLCQKHAAMIHKTVS